MVTRQPRAARSEAKGPNRTDVTACAATVSNWVPRMTTVCPPAVEAFVAPSMLSIDGAAKPVNAIRERCPSMTTLQKSSAPDPGDVKHSIRVWSTRMAHSDARSRRVPIDTSSNAFAATVPKW